MILSKPVISALIIVIGSSPVMAGEESMGTLPSFTEVDADHNGGISRTEARQVLGLVEAFSAIDVNTDGWLDHDEYTAQQLALTRGGCSI